MNILVYEWLVGGGLLIDRMRPDPRDHMLNQGQAMLAAISQDFQRAGASVYTIIDQRCLPVQVTAKSCFVRDTTTLRRTLTQRAKLADAIFLIAPESNDRLLQLHDWLRPFSSKLISPNRAFVEISSSKFATSKRLVDRSVQHHLGKFWQARIDPWPPQVRLPAVIKPDDGAGSENVRLVKRWSSVDRPTTGTWCVEPFVVGDSLSVVALCGPVFNVLLAPTYQRFAKSPIGNYIGGEFPVASDLEKRVRRAAAAALNALPKTIGIVGLDMVAEPNGKVSIVDVNPRLTSSYLGLRQIYRGNLGDAFLRILNGHPTHLRAARASFQFTVRGGSVPSRRKHKRRSRPQQRIVAATTK